MEQVDRRAFIQKAGIAGAAAAGIWAAPSVLGINTAFAGESCVKKGSLTWGTTPLRTTPTGTGTGPTNPLYNGTGIRTFFAQIPAQGAGPAGVVKVTVTATTSNMPGRGQDANGNLSTGGVNASVPYPPGTNPVPTGLNGHSDYYAINMDNRKLSSGYTVTFEFFDALGATAIKAYNLKFSLYDIDLSTSGNTYVDAVWLSDTPAGVTRGAILNTSYVTGGGLSTNKWSGSTVNAAGGVTNNNGDVAITYTGGIKTVSVYYQSNASTAGANQIQYIGISNLTWCY